MNFYTRVIIISSDKLRLPHSLACVRPVSTPTPGSALNTYILRGTRSLPVHNHLPKLQLHTT